MKSKRQPIYFSIEKDIKEQIDDMCIRSGLTRSQLIRMMINRELTVDIPAETCCMLNLADELGKDKTNIQRARSIMSELIKMKGVN